MARYIKDFQTNTDPQIVHSAVNQYLQSEGYEYINYDGENVFKKGQGVWANPMFFKFSYSGNMVRMETWMKYAFFPGVYIGELGITGFVGSAVKGSWKKRITNLEGILFNMATPSLYHPTSYVQCAVNNFGTNDNQLLNGNDYLGETCMLNESQEGSITTNFVFCTNCGTQLPEGMLFCSVCGQQRTDANIQCAVQQNNAHNQQAYSQQNTLNDQNTTYTQPTGYNVSRKEFINNYAQPSLRKNITSIAILCYVCAGLTFIVSCLVNPLGVIDALILAGLALGMHLAKSKICAILILIFSIIEVLLSLVSGSFPFWWLIAGVSAVITFNKIEKQYKSFVSNGNRNTI